ncbi:probable protein disulfide-isomerase precursor [Cephalotrichum gorgonifer]|uniref:protein disulfide-isomerase n=1 Tax=Cephalotrichum gorgonifer TaxID=2041049 RepID=A0AAE8SSV4_9PEZI|nr:probable protein disulfide-isomerase precursor [Cephalotrichum gorgonifer]
MVLLKTFALSALVAAAAAKSAVLDLIPKNFDKLVHESGKPTLVEFFAPWCGHCKNLAPIYEELALAFEHSDGVQIAKVDADAEKSLGKRYGVQGYPTLKFFDGVSETPQEYSGGRDLESLSKFITEKTGVKPKTKWAAPPKVQTLSGPSLKDVIGKEKNVFVAYTAPWCGHCKNLAPTWESLAESFEPEENILIAKVDCDAEPNKPACAEEGVTGFPTIKWYPASSAEGEVYQGGRAEIELARFINRQAGTHRLAGGVLDDVAGTVEKLDEVVASFVAGGAETLADSAAEAARVAGELETEAEKAASAYYLRVFEKLAANAEYVEKETARLGRVLEKGGLARSKSDEIQRKLNVLRKFVKPEEEAKDEL